MSDLNASIQLVELEHRIAEQEKTIADLSEMVVEQWKKIDMLERRLGALREEFEASSSSRSQASEPPPPHY
ncbi:MAG: SlyX family protein [Alphaproteobacteria bacterium]